IAGGNGGIAGGFLASAELYVAPFSAPKNISSSSGDSRFPRIAVDSAGSINVVWEDNVVDGISGDVFFGRSADGGATFSAPKFLSTNSAPSFAPIIAVDSSRNINVVWLGV